MFKSITELLKEPITNPHNNAIFIDWQRKFLDIVEQKAIAFYVSHSGDWTSYPISFDRFNEQPWCYHLAEKNWMTVHDIASVAGAMQAVISYNYIKPATHKLQEAYDPYSPIWNINDV